MRLLHSHIFCLVRLRQSQWFLLRKQPIFRCGFPAKWRLRNERRNSIMMTLTSQIWIELLIGRKFSSSNQKLCADLGTDASPVWNFCDHFEGKAPVASRNIIRRIGRKWKRSGSYNSHSVGLMNPIFHFHWGHKGSYYSDSMAREIQPQVTQ